ncbi:hypothetical protein LV779_10925 [Streptomyces thinghirensis]|nr:hypothetical protein [Streptomyces thinghirensis]
MDEDGLSPCAGTASASSSVGFEVLPTGRRERGRTDADLRRTAPRGARRVELLLLLVGLADRRQLAGDQH